jgi:urease accessory protein
MILNAALRCAKVSHIETQRILYDMADTAVQLYEEVRELNIEDMNSFAPQIDILAAMHETGDSRMFMS